MATSTAAGGAGGSATGGTQSQSASANGSNDSSYNSTTNVEAPKIPVATAYSPTAIPTVPCFKGFGAGVQTVPVGASFGGGKVDENCAILETARSFALSGSRLAYCKTMLINKYAKKGVSLLTIACATSSQPRCRARRRQQLQHRSQLPRR
jgi:hypothetical protein